MEIHEWQNFFVMVGIIAIAFSTFVFKEEIHQSWGFAIILLCCVSIILLDGENG